MKSMQETTSSRGKSVFLASALLYLMTLAAYINTFEAPPVLDDFHSFIDQPAVKVTSWSSQEFMRLSKTIFGWGRWIPMITFSWDIWIGKGELFFLHLTNLIFHYLCFFAVVFLVSGIANRARGLPSQVETLISPCVPALWVAGLWVLHPVQSSTVTYLVQRMTSIMSLFYLLSIACYIKARSEHALHGTASRRTFFFLICSFISMFLAFLSKQNSFMLPIMILITEVWFFDSAWMKSILRVIRRRWVVCTLFFTAAFTAFLYKVPQLLQGYSYRHFTLLERLLTEARVVVWYISVLLWPNPDRLSLEHHFDLSTGLLTPPSTLASILVIGILISWSIWKRKSYPLATYGLVWFFLNLAIESTFIPLELVFEHRVYLPSVGLILTMVVCASALLSRIPAGWVAAKSRTTLGWCLVAILASAFTLGTFARNQVWETAVKLHTHDARLHPGSPRAHSNLAVALARAGLFEEAVREAEEAIEVGIPNYEADAVAVNILVISHFRLGPPEEAIEIGERYLRERPPESDVGAVPIIMLNLGRIRYQTGDLYRAYDTITRAFTYNRSISPGIPEFEIPVSVLLEDIAGAAAAKEEWIDLDGDGLPDPGDLPPKAWVAQHFLRWGDRNTALKLLERALIDNPDHVGCKNLHELIENQVALDKMQEEKKDFLTKYVYHPFSPFNARMAVGFVLQKWGRGKWLPRVGESLIQQALQMEPNSPDAHLLMGWYHFKNDEPLKAAAEARRALELDPEYARAWLGLGFFLQKADQPDAAVEAFQKTLDLYPGFPDRLTVKKIIAFLKDSKSIEGPGVEPAVVTQKEQPPSHGS